jgi:hypothetical protein
LISIPGGTIFAEQKVADLIKIIDGGTQKMPKIGKKWLFTSFRA